MHRCCSTQHDICDRFFTPNLVRFVVGAERKEYFVHQHLCHNSKSLPTILGQDTKGDPQTPVTLLDTNSRVFKMFISWFYSRSVPECNTREDWIIFAELYVMAEKHDVEELMNKTMDRLRLLQYDDAHLEAAEIRYVYEKTGENSRLRRLVSEVIVACAIAEGTMLEPYNYPYQLESYPELVVDLLKAVARRVQSSGGVGGSHFRISANRKCWYHKHLETECAKD